MKTTRGMLPLIKNNIIYTMVVCFLSAINLYGQPNELSKNPLPFFCPGPWSYYVTNHKNEPIEHILAKYSSGQFKPVNQAVLNAGIPKQYYWVHFSIANQTPKAESLVIDLDNSRLNEMELFETDGSYQSLGRLGDFYPFFQRSVLHKNFIYQTALLPKQKKDYFLFINQVGHAFILPIKILTVKNFSSTTFKDYLFDGVTYGILLFVAVLSFMFFVASKHYLYLYYGLYIVTAIAWFLGYFGLGYQYIWGNHPAVNTSMAPFMASVNVFLNLQICQVLLRLAKTSAWLNTLANCIKAGLVLSALFPLFCNLNAQAYFINHTYLVLFLSIILSAMVIVSFSVILSALKGLLAARLYLVASLLKAGSIVHLALLEFGLAPATYNMEGLLQVGIFIEITLLTYALATRYADFKVKTFVKVIEAHEKERAMISKEIHDGISNSLTGISYGIKNFTQNTEAMPIEKKAQLEKVFEELNKVQLEARSISHNTMPDYVRHSSITEMVEKYLGEMQGKISLASDGKNALQINFSANKQLVNFSEAVKLNIFRIIQEITTNILKHSKATNADILFSFSRKGIIIIAEDNGIGLTGSGKENSTGMGLKNIRTRVDLLDGSFTLKSPVYKLKPEINALPGNFLHSAEYGTMIKIRIPYNNNLFNNNTAYEY